MGDVLIGGAGPEGCAEVHLSIRHEARSQLSIGGEAQAVTLLAEVIADLADEPYGSHSIGEFIGAGGSIGDHFCWLEGSQFVLDHFQSDL